MNGKPVKFELVDGKVVISVDSDLDGDTSLKIEIGLMELFSEIVNLIKKK